MNPVVHIHLRQIQLEFPGRKKKLSGSEGGGVGPNVFTRWIVQ